MDVKELKDLIKFISKTGVAEVKYKDDAVQLTVTNTMATSTNQIAVQSVPVAATNVSPTEINSIETKTETATKTESIDSNLVTIKSPMIGTFYRKPSPDKDVFINVGDEVNETTVVCVYRSYEAF